MIEKEAQNHSTRKHFEKHGRGAYQAAQKLGKLNEVCAHMNFQKNFYSDEELHQIAKRYTTRGEFDRKNKNAYEVSRNRDLLDDICSHMTDSSYCDNDAVYLWKATDEKYNDKPLYKIGVTSTRLGTYRIEKVAQKKGWKYEIIILKDVKKNADKLEKELLKIGDNPHLTGFDGASEFRALSSFEETQILKLINDFCLN